MTTQLEAAHLANGKLAAENAALQARIEQLLEHLRQEQDRSRERSHEISRLSGVSEQLKLAELQRTLRATETQIGSLTATREHLRHEVNQIREVVSTFAEAIENLNL